MGTLKFFFSIIFLFIVTASSAQLADSLVDETPWLPSFVRFSYDAAALGVSTFSNERFIQEGRVEMDFNHLFLVMEFGYEERNLPIGYSSDGAYFRVGPDVNLIKYDKGRNAITLWLFNILLLLRLFN